MQKNKYTVSIVIPAYNEELHLSDCLEAISRQTSSPLEVIVVDNNSSDSTAKVAKRFPFVKLLNEPRQGVVYARNRGFNTAHGQIIARIDADTIVPINWVETIQVVFDNSYTDALSGAIRYYDMPMKDICDKVDLFFRRRLARLLGKDVFLQGSNMAIKRSAWKSIRQNVCLSDGLHEDFDLAIHLRQAGLSVVFDERLVASISLRRIDVNFRSFWHYVIVNPGTYAKHNVAARKHMYPMITLVLIHYPLIKLMHRGFNPETGGFSIFRLIGYSSVQRVDPTLNRL